ncbi:MAG: fibronectin type III domain-containing protein [Dehalococcoidia bacterium]|nr:fibronectin type III domain-containing protein [Dehalococcoidia bacterium]MDD5493056.1 fibronectin type III domain-containing protein [Dehalococcoidia bacterium]
MTWFPKQQQAEDKKLGSTDLSPQKKSPVPLLLGIVLILVVIGAGIYFLIKLFEKPGQPVVIDNTTPDNPVERVIADTTAPQISDIKVINLNYNSVEIQWNTDELSTSQVYYREKSDYSQPTSSKEAMVKQHSIVLAELKTKTSYFYQVRSMDAAGNEAISEEKSFDIGLQPGTSKIEILDTRWSSEEHPPETKTYIKGQIRNTGDTVLNIKDIEVILTIEIAGKPGLSEVIAPLDSYPLEISPGSTHGFSALVPNGTSPHYTVNARVIK